MSTEVSVGAASADEPQLKRAIGPKLLFFFVIGDIIGTGLYALLGNVSSRVGGALWLPFLIAFAVAMLTAFSYLELVGKYPQAAGAALYTSKAFNIRFLTFLVAFTVMCSGLTSSASAAYAFGNKYFTEAFQIHPPTWLIPVCFLGLIALINFRGVAESMKVNFVLTLVKLTGVLIVVLCGVYGLSQGQGDAGRLLEFNTGEQSAFIAITSATSLAFFAMVGFEDSVNMAEETKDPVKTFPKSMLLAMAGAGVIYLIVSVIGSWLLSPEVLGNPKSNALLEIVRVGAPGFPSQVFAVFGMLSVVNAALLNMLMASRLIYGMSNERIIPKQLGIVHPFRRTPWMAIMLTTGIAMVLVTVVPLDTLGGTTALLLLMVFTLVNIAVLVLRRKEQSTHEHFVAPSWTPIVGAIGAFFLVGPWAGRPAAEYKIAGLLLALGVALWFINRLFVGKVDFDPEALSQEPHEQ
ncbi:APC family permease [Pseudonocardiaceae bacterium YIM PH 21723]|nr:APC family permease [Pseudonocardiaceae bacterium YIM PH 21723]